MKYLTPEIATFFKGENQKTLAKPNVSCGIFQDLSNNEKGSVLNYAQFNLKEKK
ncbi:hypothetical protein [Cognatitamlana onchidii]|uniref:hypothetical protein n=1 Tax=Cognatitamlana onchidii TaxID=2562860 RepID=UPI001455F122|nr:hypothetical protein [Algibacter onchidii]